MTLPVSVIVVSRGRPQALMRCLDGLGQLDYAAVEVVVVACPEGASSVGARADAAHIKLIGFDRPNISKARNLGIAAAAGEVVAFIDDDAVPEPLWLRHLIGPFETSEAAATGGYVIGRNGISFQWTARSVDGTGEAVPLAIEGTDPALLHPIPGRAVKLEGTNMAVRRDLLADMGGFDPAFHFYLDETDLNMRLALGGHAVALVPLAQVHHGYEASARRAADRTPRDLTQIGASQMVFLRKYCDEKRHKAVWRSFRNGQRQRLIRAMQRGPLGADDVLRLMRGLDRGRKEGLSRALTSPASLPRAPEGFRPFPTRPGAPRVILSGRIWQAKALRKKAAKLVQDGAIVSLYLLGPSRRKHRVWFAKGGYWEQNGGLWGRSLRNASRSRTLRFKSRVAAEIARVADVRGDAI